MVPWKLGLSALGLAHTVTDQMSDVTSCQAKVQVF